MTALGATTSIGASGTLGAHATPGHPPRPTRARDPRPQPTPYPRPEPERTPNARSAPERTPRTRPDPERLPTLGATRADPSLGYRVQQLLGDLSAPPRLRPTLAAYHAHLAQRIHFTGPLTPVDLVV